MQRILVVGVSCAGKTELARRLSLLLNIDHTDLDDLHWNRNWEPTPIEQFTLKVKEVIAMPAWIISGNYSSVQEQILPQADTLIWLDYSRWVVWTRALRRTLRRVILKEQCCNGNYETFKLQFLSADSILLWIYKTYNRRRQQYLALKDSNRVECFVHLKNPGEAVLFLDKCKKEQQKAVL